MADVSPSKTTYAAPSTTTDAVPPSATDAPHPTADAGVPPDEALLKPAAADPPDGSDAYFTKRTVACPSVQHIGKPGDVHVASELLLCPITKPIDHDRLVAEVKGIYAGLMLLESKAKELDSNPPAVGQYTAEQWTALNLLHTTLIREHYDFNVASQHPTARPALRRLLSKYSMPIRLWRHGVHAHLEVLRRDLPASHGHMVSFIYSTYPLLADLYEKQRGSWLEQIWAECLGDLARYRMAIQDDNSRTRQIWAATSRSWYEKVVDRDWTTGRLYHHLAILARPDTVQGLLYYAKSQCVAIPFESTSQSILTTIDPILTAQSSKADGIELAFARALGILYYESYIGKGDKPLPHQAGSEPATPESRYEREKEVFLDLLEHTLASPERSPSWREFGSQVAILLCCAVVQYGLTEPAAIASDMGRRRYVNATMNALVPEPTFAKWSEQKTPTESTPDDDALAMTLPPSFDAAKKALDLAHETDQIVLGQHTLPNGHWPDDLLPYLHVRLTFVLAAAAKEGAMQSLRASIPWGLVAGVLNSLLAVQKTKLASSDAATESEAADLLAAIASADLPLRHLPRRQGHGVLPEDWLLRALIWLPEPHFPDGYFSGSDNDDLDARRLETDSSPHDRRVRVLWLGRRIAAAAAVGSCLVYDAETETFAGSDHPPLTTEPVPPVVVEPPELPVVEPPAPPKTWAAAVVAASRGRLAKLRHLFAAPADKEKKLLDEECGVSEGGAATLVHEEGTPVDDDVDEKHLLRKDIAASYMTFSHTGAKQHRLTLKSKMLHAAARILALTGIAGLLFVIIDLFLWAMSH